MDYSEGGEINLITEAQMPHDDMVKTARTHHCAQCGGSLNVAWINGGYVLRCQDLTHNTITRHVKLSERDQQKEKEWKVTNKMDSTALTKMSQTDMVARVSKGKFPQDLTLPEKQLLAECARSYGFDPLMGEITIYQGRPFVSIDGRYRKAQETGQLDGIETRPATRQEREDWQIPDGDYFFRSDVYRKGASHPFTGWGRVRGAETTPGSNRAGDTTSVYKPVQSNPQRIAEKRADAQALRKAFHIPLPNIEDIGTPEADTPNDYVDSTATVVEPGIDEEAELDKYQQANRTEMKARVEASDQVAAFAKMQSAVTAHDTQEAVKSPATAAKGDKQVETTTDEPNDHMAKLRADMAKVNIKEPAAIGYIKNVLKVPGIVAGDNFDLAFAKADIKQQKAFADYVASKVKLI
jgi:hypothetical protein